MSEAALCSLALLFCARAQCAEPKPIEVELSYTAIVDGLTAASIDASAQVVGDTFTMNANTRTRGLMDLLVGFRSAAGSTAIVEAGKPVPVVHTADNKWRGKNRHVYLHYEKGAIVSADVVPSAAKDDRLPVPADLQKSTVDPVTAALSLMIAAETGRGCADLIPVFDGRRRYEFSCAPSEASVEPAEEGTTFRRAYLFRILAGRQKHPFWPQSKTPKALSLWFAQLDPRLPPIIVKIAARSGLIGYSVQTRKAPNRWKRHRHSRWIDVKMGNKPSPTVLFRLLCQHSSVVKASVIDPGWRPG